MTVTPDEVKTQKFTITKFRDGYDVEQVDEFLDHIAEDLEARDAEKAALESRIAELEAQLETARSEASAAPQTDAADRSEHAGAAEQTPAVAESSPQEQSQSGSASGGRGYAEGDAQKSSAMLQMALELHDKYIQDGETQRDQLIQDGEQTAKRLVEDAQTERADVLRVLGNERQDLADKIEELRQFEDEYRSTLKSYIKSQLRGLEGSPEPAGAPKLTD